MTAEMCAPEIDIVSEAANWGADAETTVRRALSEAAAALGQHGADPAVALEGAHRLAADEGHPVLFEALLEEAPGVVAEGA